MTTPSKSSPRAAKLKAAVAKWRDQPVEARRDAVHYFIDEAKQSDIWGAQEMAHRQTEEAARHRRDAKALRAAVALLKAAQGAK